MYSPLIIALQNALRASSREECSLEFHGLSVSDSNCSINLRKNNKTTNMEKHNG